MKNKIFAGNDNRGLEITINEWLVDKEVVFVSPIIFVHGNFVTQIFYYDKKIQLG